MRTLLALLTFALLYPNAGHPSGSPSPQGIDAPRISQQDFKKLVAAKNVIIVDTRNEDAFAISHIPGAIELPLEGLMTWPEPYEKTVAILLAAKKPVVTYCA